MSDSRVSDLESVAGGIAEVAAGDHPDVVQPMQAAMARARRSSTVVCVVGEYKQGKSLLVNALVEGDVCPVDDDLATSALTIVYGSDRLRATVRRIVDGEERIEEIDPSDVALYATEHGDLELRQTVRHVEIGTPGSALADGLVLIDTPGVGGLDAAQQEAVLGFLPHADALLMVTDASAELSRHEAEFLERAVAACPRIAVALTKTDLYGEWRRIQALDEGHLVHLGFDSTVFPVSSHLQVLARSDGDAALSDESGVAPLSAYLSTDISSGARTSAIDATVAEMQRALGVLRTLAVEERESLIDPAAAEQRRRELDAARTSLAELRVAGSKWNVLLQDGSSQLRTDTDFRLRSLVRELLREADTELSDRDPKADWEAWTEELRGQVAAHLGSVGEEVNERIRELAERVAAAASADVPDTTDLGLGEPPQVEWTGSDQQPGEGGGALSTGLSALRGMQSGVILLGVLGSLAGLAVITPVIIGAGVVLGGRQVAEERKRQLTRRRQEARTTVRQYLEQVQFEAGNHFQRIIADAHRSYRDALTARIEALEAQYRSAILVADRVVKEHAAIDVGARVAELDGRLTYLRDLGERVGALADG